MKSLNPSSVASGRQTGPDAVQERAEVEVKVKN